MSKLTPFRPINHMTTTEAVAQRLIGLISSGDLKSGDRLPVERDLATQLHVGRTTVREALKLLTLSGLLEVRRGRGTFVREDFSSFLANQMEWPVLLSARDVEHLFEVREAIEVHSAKLAAQKATPEEIERILIFRKMTQLPTRDCDKETEIDLQFHQAIAIGAHNPLALRLILSVQNLLREYNTLSNELAQDLSSTVEEHEAIYKAIAARDSQGAAEAMACHLQIARAWTMRALKENSVENYLTYRLLHLRRERRLEIASSDGHTTEEDPLN